MSDSDCYCPNCGYDGTEDDFIRDDSDDLIDTLQEAFDRGLIGESSYENMFDYLSAFRCPNCGERDSVVYFGTGGTTYYTSDGVVSADAYYAGLKESAEDPEMLDLLYADGIIDAEEWWERKHG